MSEVEVFQNKEEITNASRRHSRVFRMQTHEYVEVWVNDKLVYDSKDE